MPSDNEDNDKTVEDKAFDLTVRKMKTKVFPKQMPKHVSEMSKFTDYEEHKNHPIANGWSFKL